ncbi:OST-HTH/LOTUS domain-containing protein, partial [Nocardioides caeni]
TAPEVDTTADPEPPNLQSLLTRAVNKRSDDDGWAHLSAIGSYLRSASSSFDPRLYGFTKLASLVQAQPYLATQGTGSGIRVSLKGQSGRTPAKKAAAKKTATRTASKK